jgi:hypothetical protein
MLGYDWFTQWGYTVSFEMWLILQLVAVVKFVLIVGLSGLALVPAVRLMRKKVK